MASVDTNCLLQCSCCEKKLDASSHTLACLHNVCHACMEKNIVRENGNASKVGTCPKCTEAFNVEESHLLPFLLTDIKRHWEAKCAICAKKGSVTSANYWCHTCDKLFCDDCNFYHIQLLKTHICQNLERVDDTRWISLVMNDCCLTHGTDRNIFCQRCNMCFCNTCYTENHQKSGCVGERVFSVKDELLRQKTRESFILQREMKEFSEGIKRSNANLVRCNTELAAKCQLEIHQIWQRYETKIESARVEAIELCETVIRKQFEEERLMRHSLDANNQMLPQIETCLSHYQRLLGSEGDEFNRDTDVLRSLNRLKSMVQSWQEESNRVAKTVNKIDLTIDFSNLLIDLPLNSKAIPISSRVRIIKGNEFWPYEEWHLRPGLNTRRIRSIYIVKEDEHVFLVDWANRSIIELSEYGEFLTEFPFVDKYPVVFSPFDVCSISPDILVVCGEGGFTGGGKIFFLERKKNYPFLKLKKHIKTVRPFYCLCSKNEMIFCCDFLFKIHSFSKEGRKIRVIKVDGLTTGPMGSQWSIWSRIRVDPFSGNFWGSRYDCPEIISFNFEGEKLDSVKKEGKLFFDFSFNKFGHLYFPTKEGMFYFSTEKKLVYKFPQKAELDFPVISVLENKMVVWIKNEGKDLIKIFKILY